MKRYKVTISNRGNIPGMGHGPFRRPIAISEEKYKSLTKLGYRVTIVEDLFDKKLVKSHKVDEVVTPVEEPAVEQPAERPVQAISDGGKVEEVQPEEKVEEIAPTNEIEESQEEAPAEEVVEVLVDDPDLSAESFYNDSFLTSKNICKKILNARMIQYEDSASYQLLKKLVRESNPEVEFSEE